MILAFLGGFAFCHVFWAVVLMLWIRYSERDIPTSAAPQLRHFEEHYRARVRR